MYRDIPLPGWRVVFPDKLLQFRPLDLLRLDLFGLAGDWVMRVHVRQPRCCMPACVVTSPVATQPLGLLRLHPFGLAGVSHGWLHECCVGRGIMPCCVRCEVVPRVFAQQEVHRWQAHRTPTLHTT